MPDVVLMAQRAGLSGAKNFQAGSVEAPAVGLSAFFWLRGQGDIEEHVVDEHPRADSPGEFLHLLLNVGKEGIRAPPAHQHDYVDLISGRVHHHCEGGLDGICANVIAGETQLVFANGVY